MSTIGNNLNSAKSTAGDIVCVCDYARQIRVDYSRSLRDFRNVLLHKKRVGNSNDERKKFASNLNSERKEVEKQIRGQ